MIARRAFLGAAAAALLAVPLAARAQPVGKVYRMGVLVAVSESLASGPMKFELVIDLKKAKALGLRSRNRCRYVRTR